MLFFKNLWIIAFQVIVLLVGVIVLIGLAIFITRTFCYASHEYELFIVLGISITLFIIGGAIYTAIHGIEIKG